jgi:phage tail tube protein FII
VQDLLIEIIEEHHQGKMEAVVEIEATIEAPSKEEAKQMLIRLIMRETGKMNMQGSAIRGLKKIFVDKNENALYAKIIREFSNAVHRVKIKITSNDATIEP